MPRTGGGLAVDVEDLLVRVKNGAEPELGEVAREVAALAGEGRLGGQEEDDDEDGCGLLVPALLARLAGAGSAEVRVRVMAALRGLAGCVGGESKVRAGTARDSVLFDLILTSLVAPALCSMICSCGSSRE